MRDTLRYIKNLLPSLELSCIPSGTILGDWIIPDEWTIRDAWIKGPYQLEIINFKACNLHVIGYSDSINKVLSLDELKEHIYSLPDLPSAIPYVTNYYGPGWGFCMSHDQLLSLQPGDYHCFIDSDIKPGKLDYADLIVRGMTDKEILVSTYICHPSMANNELSGPAVAVALALWLQMQDNLRYTYRFVFGPETIGAVSYINMNLDSLKRNVIAGFNLTCIGDDRAYSYLPTKQGNTLADRAALKALKDIAGFFERYTWLDRGSDERQYCSPGVDLPVVSIMRSKYGAYPEYHTSLDNTEFVTPTGLLGGFKAVQRAIFILETNVIPIATIFGEPFLTKYGLIDTLSFDSKLGSPSRLILDVFSYSDGYHDVLEISALVKRDYVIVLNVVNSLHSVGLVSLSDAPKNCS